MCDHHATVLGEAGKDRKRRCAIEAIVRIEIRHMRIDGRVGRNLHVGIDTEHLPDRDFHVGQCGHVIRCGGGHHSSVASGRSRNQTCVGCGNGGNFCNLADAPCGQKPGQRRKFLFFLN
jgi:hypothetical protein